jgi:hypothetical protein
MHPGFAKDVCVMRDSGPARPTTVTTLPPETLSLSGEIVEAQRIGRFSDHHE